MKSELQALENNHTWTVVSLPPGKRTISCKWVYRIKYNADGTIERYKARLVILGNKQVEGIDYTETFALVAKFVTVRTFLAVAAARNWELHHMDVHNAFLHGELNEEVYMRLLPGFTSNKSRMVCRLKKSLYGLKQAPRCWFAKLAAALLNRARIILSLPCIGIAYIYLCLYLGPLKYVLGIEVTRNPTGIFLSQRKYVLDIISEAGLLGAKPAPFPLEPNHQLALAEGPYFSDPVKYRRLVGILIYLSATRPELSYSVHLLSQFMQQPREQYWEAALRVVRYLKGNLGQGVFLSSDCDLQLYGWCDSDWASYPLSRRSLSGWFVMLGSSLISWKFKKQHTVAQSSTEAEYRAMATVTCELKLLKGLLMSVGVDHSRPMHLYCDSQAALHLAANPVFHEQTKHIEVDCHFVRDETQRRNIRPVYVSTNIQLADIFTKALGSKEFEFLLRKLGIRDLHAPT
ncbi:retrovirus-related pol polyprotein from transposon RE1 [Citrus sinensis]|nr:retrovirus-related pol polyprotein from transposon RE1 [Citrus sinensis]